MADLHNLTIAEARALLDRGEISSVELTQALLDRIVAVDNQVRAFLAIDDESALAQARAADERLQSERDESHPLLGIPLGIKDVLSTEGLTTTCGSRILEEYVPPYVATAVARLKAAGAVLLGKLNCDEFAMGSSNENSFFGNVLNPWDKAAVPGGSSGGSAAAGAACLTPAATGTDTGGSIRMPAAACGTVGLKATFGRVSRDGIVPHSWSLDHAGPLTRTVADTALMMQVLAGYDAADPACQGQPVPDYAKALGRPVKGLKIGVCRNHFFENLQEDVENAVERAIADLAAAGAQIIELKIPVTAA